jgi:hypothetical protein
MPSANVLLAEGPDDANLLYHLLKRYSISIAERGRIGAGGIDIREGGGIDNVMATIPVWLKRSELQRLGIVIDANSDIVARWHALQNVLRNVGYLTVPPTPSTSGTIITQADLPTVGIWLMPNNMQPGMLEDFVRALVPDTDLLWSRVEQCVQQIPKAERQFPAHHLIKAHVHTWLAWQEEPGKPMGQALTKQYLDADAWQAWQLIDWIQQLFELRAT